jgi:hypothetical protein
MTGVAELSETIQRAAEELGDAEALDLSAVLRELSGEAKLQVLVVGRSGAGRASIVDALLAQPDLIPRSPLPKAPIGITVGYGPSPVAELVALDGGREAIRPGKLSGVLFDEPGVATRYARVEIQTPAELLTTCDLHIEALEMARTSEETRVTLAATDFVLLVLRATALLSQQERDFVREHLVPYGLERVAIVINQLDLIAEDERDSIAELVRTFLGPFESQPAVLELSAREALSVPRTGDAASGAGGFPALATLLSDVLEDHGALRAQTVRQAVESSIAALEAGAERQQAMAEIGREEVARLQDLIASRRDWLEERIARARNRVDAYVATLSKEQLLHEIERFGEMFRARLPDQVIPIEDVSAVRKHLPGYIEAVWLEFLQTQMIAVQSGLQDEARALTRMAETDLQDLVGDALPGLQRILRGGTIDPSAFRTFVMPRRGKHRAENIAKGLGVHGYVMLMFNPPLGVLSLAASHLVQRFFRGDIDLADKRAMIAAATTATREMQTELEASVTATVGELAASMKQDVERLYREGIALIEAFVTDTMADRDQIESRRLTIDRLLHDTIPVLRRASEDLFTGEPAREVPV